MRFTLILLGPPFILLALAVLLSGGDTEHPAIFLFGVPALLWWAIGIRIARPYWRTRIRAKAWKDARGQQRGKKPE